MAVSGTNVAGEAPVSDGQLAVAHRALCGFVFHDC